MESIQTPNYPKGPDPSSGAKSSHPERCKYPITTGQGCTCKKSRCLKLYCQCFASSSICDQSRCKCTSCENVADNVKEIDMARSVILERNPDAFDDKFKMTEQSRHSYPFHAQTRDYQSFDTKNDLYFNGINPSTHGKKYYGQNNPFRERESRYQHHQHPDTVMNGYPHRSGNGQDYRFWRLNRSIGEKVDVISGPKNGYDTLYSRHPPAECRPSQYSE